ncbi:DUF4367 domain-containing protein [Metabacillus litoralis]|uniref:DUF4367 domain-containing protein n=1 Tax=Metabacillus litoralis TaxID=152268 RepID=A0A5C6W667_9BACI|nr:MULTISPECIES: DUF4367 domain-containing protein [Metabacillus]MBM7602428.1 hypothetical protein [Metabacillus crassostreae]TXC92894.1 DUF4367 domain-containing protein [Metabacillus litoralis]
MKKIGFMLLPILLLVIGCSGGTSLTEFDNTKLKEELNDQAFQPKLPTKLPFEVEEAAFTTPPQEQQPSNILSFDFFGSGDENGKGNHLSLMAVNGGKVESNIEYEDVKIGDLNGSYEVNDEEEMILNWSENDIHYRLTFYVQQSDNELTKEELIETAKSFE